MNIKSTVRTIMYHVFTILSIFGFCIIGSVVDIGDGGSVNLIILSIIWFICIGLAVFCYNPRLYDRILFASFCVILLIHGFIHRKKDSVYKYLYEESRSADTIPEFFYKMLNVYDEYYPDSIH